MVNATLLILFFIINIVGAYNSFTRIGGPRRTLELFVHFTLTGNTVACKLSLVLSLFGVVRNAVSAVVTSTKFKRTGRAALPRRVVATIRGYSFFRDVPL